MADIRHESVLKVSFIYLRLSALYLFLDVKPSRDHFKWESTFNNSTVFALGTSCLQKPELLRSPTDFILLLWTFVPWQIASHLSLNIVRSFSNLCQI